MWWTERCALDNHGLLFSGHARHQNLAPRVERATHWEGEMGDAVRRRSGRSGRRTLEAGGLAAGRRRVWETRQSLDEMASG
jgi:hypothetical protein